MVADLGILPHLWSQPPFLAETKSEESFKVDEGDLQSLAKIGPIVREAQSQESTVLGGLKEQLFVDLKRSLGKCMIKREARLSLNSFQ